MDAQAKGWHFDSPKEQEQFEYWERQFDQPMIARAWRWLVQGFLAIPPSAYRRHGIIMASPGAMWACAYPSPNQEGERS